MPHGRCFLVHEPDRLVAEVLPRYFNQTKILSFIRQLNLWGFKRLTRGVDGKAYYHELFLRGKPYLSLRLKRMKIKGHGYKPIPNPSGEPNFYGGYPLVMDDGTTASVASAKAISPKEGSSVGSKKHRVLSRAAGASVQQEPVFGAGQCSLFQTSTTGNVTEAKPASIPVFQHQDPNVIMAMLQQRHASLTAAGIPPTEVTSPFAAQLAALASLTPSGGRQNGDSSWGMQQQQSAGLTANNLAALLGLNSSPNNGVHLQNLAFLGLQNFAAANANPADSYIETRLAQLQKEQEEIELLRKARAFEQVNNASSMSGLQALAQSGGLGLNHGQGNAQQQSNPNQMSLSESLREAQQLEEMALAARARAQLALARSMFSSNGQQNAANGN